MKNSFFLKQSDVHCSHTIAVQYLTLKVNELKKQNLDRESLSPQRLYQNTKNSHNFFSSFFFEHAISSVI